MTKRPTSGDQDDRLELCGRTLGDYEFIQRLGGGATSDVFLAKRISLGRKVALKILKDSLASDETYVKRFFREARAAAKLEHPNVARIYDVDKLVDVEASRYFWFSKKRRLANAKVYYYIEQEYVAGMSLSQYLRRTGPITIEQIFSVMEQVAQALKCASDFNLVHSDVKPENIILDPSGVIHVVDFGLARPIEANGATWIDASMNKTGVTLGTPLYMSPEQARGEKLDSRSDIYSLGVTAFQMLTGEALFSGASPLAVVLMHLNEKPRPIRELRPDVPEELANLIERMLAKKPDDRPATPDALLSELGNAKRAYLRRRSTLSSSDVVASADEKGGELFAETEVGSSLGGVSSAFFYNESERQKFEHTINAAAKSQEWQTNLTQLDFLEKSKVRYWTSRKILLTTVATLIAFLIGGGALTAINKRLATVPPEPPLSIQRFNTVEEQFVFALQTGAVDAWRSVIEYFPEEEYWVLRAKRQLAYAYVEEKDVDSADKIFSELASTASSGVDFDPFPLAGAAWVAAERGDFDAAIATLSELSYYRPNDRMTDILAAKTREIIQRRNDSPSLYLPPREGGRQGLRPGGPNAPVGPRGPGLGRGRGGMGMGAGMGGGRQNFQGPFDPENDVSFN
ncbi:MAG: protein kinase domain-containing protein [Thermoguttaceae bacterium]|jgi:serine/threonine protein kinase